MFVLFIFPIFLVCFFLKIVFSSSKKRPLQEFVLGFITKDVSSVVGAPWRCGVLTTWVGIAGIRLGHPLGREHDSTSRVGWKFLACQSGASRDCIVVVTDASSRVHHSYYHTMLLTNCVHKNPRWPTALLAIEGSKNSTESGHSTSKWTECKKWRQRRRKAHPPPPP